MAGKKERYVYRQEKWVVYQSKIVNGNKRVRVIISAMRVIIHACSMSCGVLKKGLTVQTTCNLCPSVKSVANKTFSHRLTQITLILSIYPFPGSLMLHVMINYRRLEHYRKMMMCAPNIGVVTMYRRWLDPFEELHRMQEWMNRVFGEFEPIAPGRLLPAGTREEIAETATHPWTYRMQKTRFWLLSMCPALRKGMSP
jgi:hypothetical protein